jgi:hypothetical protein
MEWSPVNHGIALLDSPTSFKFQFSHVGEAEQYQILFAGT